MDWTSDTSITDKLQYEIAIETGIWNSNTNSSINNDGVSLGAMRNYLQKRFPKDSLGYTYQYKVFTRFSISAIQNFFATALDNDTLPILSIGDPKMLSYYDKDYPYGRHFIVVEWVDFATGEVGVIDPNNTKDKSGDTPYFGKFVVSLDEIEKIAYDIDLWMVVHTKTGADPENHK